MYLVILNNDTANHITRCPALEARSCLVSLFSHQTLWSQSLYQIHHAVPSAFQLQPSNTWINSCAILDQAFPETKFLSHVKLRTANTLHFKKNGVQVTSTDGYYFQNRKLLFFPLKENKIYFLVLVELLWHCNRDNTASLLWSSITVPL